MRLDIREIITGLLLNSKVLQGLEGIFFNLFFCMEG